MGSPPLMGASASVVICAYDLGRWDRTVAAVRSVLAQEIAAAEVLVVVDHNPELLARARDTWPDLPVRVVPNAAMRGLSGARNTGVKRASSEIVAFLDDDAVAEPTWIARLLAGYSDSSVVACGGRVEPALGVTRPGWWPEEFDWVVGCSYVGLPTERADVRNVIGANMSIRRDAAIAAGGFPEGIGRVGARPVGCEETDLLISLAQDHAGARVVYEPAAVVHHWVPRSRLTCRYFRARCLAEGLSKAQVATRVGAQHALASERAYALRVLPKGMALSLRHGAPLRAIAIGAGLGLTTAGYLRARLAARRATPGFEPVRLLDIELGEALPDVEPPGHARLRVFVRLHGHPLGTVDLRVPLEGLDAGLLADAIWAGMDEKIRRHSSPRASLRRRS